MENEIGKIGMYCEECHTNKAKHPTHKDFREMLEQIKKRTDKEIENSPYGKLPKPCHLLKGFCPYGYLVEFFPIRENSKFSCDIYRHDCPIYHFGEFVWHIPISTMGKDFFTEQNLKEAFERIIEASEMAMSEIMGYMKEKLPEANFDDVLEHGEFLDEEDENQFKIKQEIQKELERAEK